MTARSAFLLGLSLLGSISLGRCDRDHRHRKPAAPVTPDQPNPPPSDNDGDDDDDTDGWDWGPFGHHGNKPGNSPDHRQDGEHRNDRSIK
jgi:hypothetical protein